MMDKFKIYCDKILRKFVFYAFCAVVSLRTERALRPNHTLYFYAEIVEIVNDEWLNDDISEILAWFS